MTLQQFKQSIAAMNKRQVFLVAAVLLVGLVVGYTAGRFQAGRYQVHSIENNSIIYAMYRYDTNTGRTWLCYMRGLDTGGRFLRARAKRRPRLNVRRRRRERESPNSGTRSPAGASTFPQPVISRIMKAIRDDQSDLQAR